MGEHPGLQLLTLPIALCMAMLSLPISWSASRYAHVPLTMARTAPLPASQ